MWCALGIQKMVERWRDGRGEKREAETGVGSGVDGILSVRTRLVMRQRQRRWFDEAGGYAM